MKLKTTINGKQSTVIGTPEEVAEFLEVARKKAIHRAVDALPRTVKLGAGERVLAHVNGRLVERKVAPVPFKPAFTAISQTREEIVKEAIADVAELLGRNHPECKVSLGAWFVNDGGTAITDYAEFKIYKPTRKVVAKVRSVHSGSIHTTGIARCAPSDVFNEHVGKAIALRRALGLPVPTKYYEVGGIAPEGKQVGDVAIYTSGIDGESKVNVVEGHVRAVRGGEIGVLTSLAVRAKVIDDSARYVAPSTPAAKVVYVD